MAMHRKPDPVKHCENCGTKMSRKRINGRLEDMGVFRRRKHCDRECMAAAMVKESPTRDAHRKRVQHLKGEKCEMCGITENLQIHHRDHDWSNDDPMNIATLCGTCHMTHHWKVWRRAGGQASCTSREEDMRKSGPR